MTTLSKQKWEVIFDDDLRSEKLGNKIIKEASEKHISIEKYNPKCFPDIPIRKTNLPYLSYLPLIVLISRKLLDRIWSTSSKNQFIREISDYSEYLLHIWVGDLDEKQMKKYSTYLIQRKERFHIVREKELIHLGSDWFKKIYDSITDPRKPTIIRPFCILVPEDGFHSLPEKHTTSYLEYTPETKKYASMPAIGASGDILVADNGSTSSNIQSTVQQKDSPTITRERDGRMTTDGVTRPRPPHSRDARRDGREFAKSTMVDGPDDQSGSSQTRNHPKKKKQKKNPKKKK